MTTLIRYLTACTIATIASFLLLFLLTNLSGVLISRFPANYNFLGTLLPSLTFIIIGFSGTFIGSYFLQRSTCIFGAIALTILGLIAGAIFWLVGANLSGFDQATFTSFIYMELYLFLGAFLNVWIQKIRNTAEQDAAANP